MGAVNQTARAHQRNGNGFSEGCAKIKKRVECVGFDEHKDTLLHTNLPPALHRSYFTYVELFGPNGLDLHPLPTTSVDLRVEAGTKFAKNPPSFFTKDGPRREEHAAGGNALKTTPATVPQA